MIKTVREDGYLNLHTRSLKYGKLGPGVLIIVSPSIIRRRKNHVSMPKLLILEKLVLFNSFSKFLHISLIAFAALYQFNFNLFLLLYCFLTYYSSPQPMITKAIYFLTLTQKIQF